MRVIRGAAIITFGRMAQVLTGNFSRHNLIIFFVIFLAACGDKNGNLDSFDSLNCTSPSIAQIEPWGKSGIQQICKIKHGPFVASENGYIHLRGNYRYGEESGVWKWYDRAGKVVKEIDYGKGTED